MVKNLPANAGYIGSMPGLGRSPGKGNGYPLQDSCLENPMDRGAWQAVVHGVTKSRTRLSDFTFTSLSVIDSALSLPWAWVPSLVGELRSRSQETNTPRAWEVTDQRLALLPMLQELLSPSCGYCCWPRNSSPDCLSAHHQNMEQVSKVLIPDHLPCAMLAAGSVVETWSFFF